MKQDIRELFKENSSKKKLPKGHRHFFEQKLDNSFKKETKKHWLGIVAGIIVTIFSGYVLLFSGIKKNEVKEPALLLEVQKMEIECSKKIEDEWRVFLSLTKDKRLINSYQLKLSKLTKSYKNLIEKIKHSPNDVSALELLIENLQKRVEILNDIKNRINDINQKNITYETVVL